MGLLTLRTSLWVLNELLYQAFWTEKLPFISEDSIVKLGPITSTIAGMGVSLIATPRQLESPSDPQLFLYKVPDDALPDIGLCRMELQSHSYSADYGDTIEISARAVDDNLNPYGPLLKHL